MNISIKKRLGLVSAAAVLLLGCEKPIVFPRTDLAQADIIPIPVSIQATNSAFAISEKTQIVVKAEELKPIGTYLSGKIEALTALKLVESAQPNTKSDIIIDIKDSLAQVSDEAYELIISDQALVLNAASAEAAFRGVQTIRQLLPQTSVDTLAAYPMWLVPTGTISDYPNFEYRSAMLDVARHFFEVDEVKKYIELLAYYKYNTFHIHLTDDQGWRIEIKSWPKLTEISSSSEVGGTTGGFYTQEQFKDIVAFAEQQFITVVPEVDMPGHTNAASYAYPFLNGNGKELKVHTGMQVGFSTFDTHKDSVYAFIDDVIGEISGMTPGPYFHVGGDESHVTKKEDYIQFIERVEKIVHKHHKIMVGWNEITQSQLSQSSVPQLWHWSKSDTTIVEKVKKGNKMIISPGHKTYLDMQYDTLSVFGLHWAAYVPEDSAYLWNPETYVPGVTKESILGLEAPLWTETVSNMSEAEYLIFPRAISIAELAWSKAENRNWDDHKRRLAHQAPYLDAMNVKYYKSSKIDWPEPAK